MSDETIYEHDAAGRLVAIRRPTSREVFVYDEHGRLVEHRIERPPGGNDT